MTKNTDEKAEKPAGVGAIATEAMRDGKTNEEALAAVQKAHPGTKTTMSSINWYRNKLRGNGIKMKGSSKLVPTSRELKAAATKAAEKSAKAADKKPAEADPLA